MDRFELTIDHAQRRLSREEMGFTCIGADWDLGISTNVHYDDTTGQVFCMPAPFTAEWSSQSSGVYSKFAKSASSPYALSFTTAASWENQRSDSIIALWGKNVNEAVTSSSSFDPYQPFLVRWYCNAPAQRGNDRDGLRLEVYLGTTSTYWLKLIVYPQGRIEVYDKDATLLGLGNARQERRKGADAQVVGSAGQGQGGWITLLIIPAGVDDSTEDEPTTTGVLVMTDMTGSSFTVSAPRPTATSYKLAWWVRNPTGATNNALTVVESAPLQFISGTLYSQRVTLPKLPHIDTPETLGVFRAGTLDNAPEPTVTLVGADDLQPYNRAAHGLECRLRVALAPYADTTQSLYGGSPIIQAGYAIWAGDASYTDDDRIELLGAQPVDAPEENLFDITALEIEKPDDIGGASVRFAIRNPRGVELQHGDRNLQSIVNRPARLAINRGGASIPIIDGYLGAPELEEDSPNPCAHYLSCEIADVWRSFESYVIRRRIFLGGYTWKDALEALILMPGTITREFLDIEDINFTLPLTSGIAREESDAGPMIQVGDTVADAIRMLMDMYAPLDYFDFIPRASGIYAVYRRVYDT